MLAAIPAPVHDHIRPLPLPQQPVSTSLIGTFSKETPPYGTKERKLQTLRKPEDYGDGGAFPEIQKPQYPLMMGKEAKQGVAKTGKTLAVTTNADGEISWDAIVRQGRNKHKTFETGHSALVPKVADGVSFYLSSHCLVEPSAKSYLSLAWEVTSMQHAKLSSEVMLQPACQMLLQMMNHLEEW